MNVANIFTGEGIQLNNEPTIMLIGSICHPFLVVLNKIFFTNRESLAAHSLCPIHTLCMLQEESFQNRKENRFFQIAFFKEIYDLNDKHLILDQHQFWLIDNINETFDLVFLDADKENYIEYYKLFIDKVKKGGLIIADNVLWTGKVVDPENHDDDLTKYLIDFNKMIAEDNRVENIILPLRDGLNIILKS